MSEKKTLTCEDLGWDKYAPHYYVGEAGEREQEWFRKAWGHIVKAGLADYFSELDRCEVLMRAVALEHVHSVFMKLLCEDDYAYPPDASEPASDHGISALQLALLLDTKDRGWFDGTETENEFYAEAVKRLVDRQRAKIHQALAEGFGGIHGPSSLILFASMLRAGYPGDAADLPEDDFDLADWAEGRYDDAVYFVICEEFTDPTQW